MIESKFPSRWEGGLNLVLNLNLQVVSWPGGRECPWWAAAMLPHGNPAPADVSRALSFTALHVGDAWDYWVPIRFPMSRCMLTSSWGSPCLITKPLTGHKLPLSAKFCTSPTLGLKSLERQATEYSCVLASCAPRLRTSARASSDKMALVISTCRFPPHWEIPLLFPTLGAVLWG